MRRFLASTLGQIVAIIVSAMLATSLLLAALVYMQNLQAGAPWPWAIVHRIVSLVNLLEGVPPQHLPSVTLLASAQRPNLLLTVDAGDVQRCSERSAEAMLMELALRSELPHIPQLSVAACDTADEARNIQVRVPIGPHVVDIRTGTLGYHPLRFGSPWFGALLFLLVCVLSMSVWAILRVVLPLRRLAENVERFSQEVSPAAVVEQGPLEIRSVARALNNMQQRISGLVDDRTRMLAAVSHDLRTPLTRMRLQLEHPSGAPDPGKLRRNLDLMQTTVDAALAFLAGGHAGEPAEWIDLDALLATLCDEYEEAGAQIRYEGPGHIRLHCRPAALQRALGNLLDNAVAHGSHVQVVAAQQGATVRIEILDDGPGIPAAQLHSVLQPFMRVQGQASTHSTGLGLGLAVVNGIIQAHGGSLGLSNRDSGGLQVVLLLPQHSIVS